MSTFEHYSSLRVAPRQVWAVRALHAISGVYRTWRNRRAFLQLGEMSDTELADIGLRRGDLHAVVGSPFGVDPTARLNAIVHGRHQQSASF